jgi:hypothetical protein
VDVSLKASEFQTIDAAKAFDLDVPASAEGSSCVGGTARTSKGIAFCVTNESSDKTTNGECIYVPRAATSRPAHMTV